MTQPGDEGTDEQKDEGDDLEVVRGSLREGDVRDGAAGRAPLPGEEVARGLDDEEWRRFLRARRNARPPAK